MLPRHINSRRVALACALVAFLAVPAALPALARPAIDGPAVEPPAPTPAPAVRVVFHIVSKGDTLWSIARAYGLTVAQLSRLNGNPDPLNLQPGQRLTVAGGSGLSARQAGQLVRFLWPLRGTLTSLFGPRWGKLHTGIDIAASYGADIRAALGGIVDTAAWLRGYGRTVILDHGDGFETLYAHASKLLVEKGEQVTPGEIIAKVGSSGNSTGPHLHFEVRIGGECVDPHKLLE
ncbi:MAG: LysM peptidoglycan-binding domain-containing M23 family metallopeptidase [Chloroflexota bacterium]